MPRSSVNCPIRPRSYPWTTVHFTFRYFPVIGWVGAHALQDETTWINTADAQCKQELQIQFFNNLPISGNIMSRQTSSFVSLWRWFSAEPKLSNCRLRYTVQAWNLHCCISHASRKWTFLTAKLLLLKICNLYARFRAGRVPPAKSVAVFFFFSYKMIERPNIRAGSADKITEFRKIWACSWRAM